MRILGGEDFPQRVGLVLNIGGGRFSGHFDGDLFYITDRVHQENEAAAAKAYSNATTGEDCPPSSPPGASYDFQMKVPEGYGGAWVEGGYGSPIFVRDVIRRHGYVITTSAPTTRPTTSQVARHFWAEAGSRATIASDEPIYYVVSIVPGTVLAVKAYKTFNHQRKLVNVPDDLWHVESRQYGPITAVMVVTQKPLSTIQDQGWEDDLYVTFESDVGPHIIDILKYVIDNYTDLSYDDTSFEAVRPKLDPFPANFPILRRKNTLEVLQEIAFQARCALWISNGVFYIKYLPEEPDVDDTITASDVDAESGIEVELTPAEDIVTKMVVTWHLSWAEEEPNRLILRHNVAKYGTQEEEYDSYIYNQPDIVLKCATFWLIRLANTWKKVRFSTALNKLNLETFDTVNLALGSNYVVNGEVKAVVEQANYNSTENTVDFECWVPVRSGEMEEYRFAWPSQVDPQWTFPTDEDIEAGHSGGASIGQGATGELPVGFTDLPGWGEGVVFVGGPNIIFRGHADWGDRHPSDVDFEPQQVIRTETYAEISASPNPNPDLTLNYVDPISPPPLMPNPAETFVIDLHRTTIIDSESDGREASLGTFFKRVNENGQLVVDADLAKFGDDEHPDGETFDFKFDDEGGQFGAGTAFLKDD